MESLTTKLLDITPDISLWKGNYSLIIKLQHAEQAYLYYSTTAGVIECLKKRNIEIEPAIIEKLKAIRTSYKEGKIYVEIL